MRTKVTMDFVLAVNKYQTINNLFHDSNNRVWKVDSTANVPATKVGGLRRTVSVFLKTAFT